MNAASFACWAVRFLTATMVFESRLRWSIWGANMVWTMLLMIDCQFNVSFILFHATCEKSLPLHCTLVHQSTGAIVQAVGPFFPGPETLSELPRCPSRAGVL